MVPLLSPPPTAARRQPRRRVSTWRDLGAMRVYSESERRRQSQLIEEGDRLKDLLGSLRSAATDRAEYEAHDVTDDEAALQADAAETRLVAVEAALDRIEAGEYGLCRACGSAIAEERLDAVSATDMCRACV